MLQLDCLPAETRRLLDHLAACPEMERFTLIGGTALALSWGHRLSEDLDFAFPGLDLPRKACDRILDHLSAREWSLEDVSNPLTRLYQENEGADLADSQQDWLCRYRAGPDGVKLTFFAEYDPVKQRPYGQFAPVRHGHVRIMPADGIFLLKSQLLLHRHTSRDLFDLWAFLERGKTVEDILAAARLENKRFSYERLRAALLPSALPASDPGLASLVPGGPSDLDGIRTALQPHVDAYEERMAADILLQDSEPFTP
jgi:predicted nucleotidyltransferase component of viral defense system